MGQKSGDKTGAGETWGSVRERKGRKRRWSQGGRGVAATEDLQHDKENELLTPTSCPVEALIVAPGVHI